MYLLALIGVFAIWWAVSKGLRKLGRWMEGFGDALCTFSRAMNQPSPMRRQKQISQEEIPDKRGSKHDPYLDSVRREIEEITQ